MIEKLKKLQAIWKELALAGTWLATIAGSFLLPLPDWAMEDENKAYSQFILFVSTVLAGFILALTFKLKKKRIWGFISGFAFIVFIGSFFFNMWMRDVATAPYHAIDGVSHRVIGTDTVAGFSKKKDGLDSALGFSVNERDLLNYVGGDASILWTESSIKANMYKLVFSLMFSYAALAIFLISFLNFLLISKPDETN